MYVSRLIKHLNLFINAIRIMKHNRADTNQMKSDKMIFALQKWHVLIRDTNVLL